MNYDDLKLTIELIPKSLWGQSIAKKYQTQWNRLRFPAYERAGHQCEICRGTGNRTSARNPGGLECHEVWEYTYNGNNATQKLIRLIALCPDCHHVKHMGRSYNVMTTAEFESLIQHFMWVNDLTKAQYHEYSAQLTETWQYHNSLNWTQDISAFLEQAGPVRQRYRKPKLNLIGICQDQSDVDEHWVDEIDDDSDHDNCECECHDDDGILGDGIEPESGYDYLNAD